MDLWRYKNTGLIGMLGILCECRPCRVVFIINEGQGQGRGSIVSYLTECRYQHL